MKPHTCLEDPCLSPCSPFLNRILSTTRSHKQTRQEQANTCSVRVRLRLLVLDNRCSMGASSVINFNGLAAIDITPGTLAMVSPCYLYAPYFPAQIASPASRAPHSLATTESSYPSSTAQAHPRTVHWLLRWTTS